MVSPILAQIGVPVVTQILMDALGTVDHPVAKRAANALGFLDDALRNGQISSADLEEANRYTEEMTRMNLEAQDTAVQETQKTYRKELASNDLFIRRMRPTFGYLMALTWAAQMLALAYVIVFRTGEAHLVIEAMESLGMIWTVGLSVLGIYVYKRSEEKKWGNQLGIPLTKADQKERRDTDGQEHDKPVPATQRHLEGQNFNQ